jgi:hypothetical protein
MYTGNVSLTTAIVWSSSSARVTATQAINPNNIRDFIVDRYSRDSSVKL